MDHERRQKPDLNEAVLISLDQLSQTLEVMAQVITRLKTQLAAPEPSQPSSHDRRSTDVKDLSQVRH
ncbi:hypothetical protein QWY82_08465 [Simiduia curdlanivorans]|uniref:Uncharacterized protein n=1 Tax=Simiduia curdlanivorans TaxID=1492769 RepID=A0ABV8V6K0_9GAMM|nr:hypothetical protein [Simiduia curdlanivorans]MDN3638836.1 hypothetical protein [Simiduia curdlanivorans]